MKILIVDDNPNLMSYIEKKVTEAGHEVVTALDGLSAIQALLNWTPDVIFTDYFLPSINGDVLCRIIRNMDHLKETYLVIVSAAAKEMQLDPSKVCANALIAKGTFEETAQHFFAALADAGKSRQDSQEHTVMGMDSVYSRRITVELLEKYGHLQTLLDSMSEGILEIYSGRIVYVNQAGITILGRQADQLLAACPLTLFDESERPKIEAIIESEYKEKAVVNWKTPDGEKILSVKTLLPKRDEDTIILLIEDITERVHAEQALQSYQNHLETLVEERNAELKRTSEQLCQAQKMEAVGTLAGGIAHDFNNILTVIMGLSSRIQSTVGLDDRLRQLADQIVVSSERAADLTKGLLAFSRKQQINVEPHDLNAVVTGTAKLLRRLLPEDIALKVKPADQAMVALIDIALMDQVLMNLGTNARDAMPTGGMLTINIQAVTLDETFKNTRGLVKSGRYVLLSVSDTGTGMDAETIARIFDPFFTTKPLGKGTGLGLSSVYGIVKQHDGYIDVTSELGKGTTFDIYLPLVDAKVEPKAVADVQVKGGSETILVIEDDADVRSLIRDVLSEHGYDTVEAADGNEGVSVFNEHRGAISLIILDVVMPGKSGKDVLEEINSICPDVKAIFMSGYTGDIVLEKGVRGDNVDFLQKPLSLPKLLGKVREVLDR
jgi:PAS domain S-box-containing protein